MKFELLWLALFRLDAFDPRLFGTGAPKMDTGRLILDPFRPRIPPVLGSTCRQSASLVSNKAKRLNELAVGVPLRPKLRRQLLSVMFCPAASTSSLLERFKLQIFDRFVRHAAHGQVRDMARSP